MIDFTKEECLHVVMALNIFSVNDNCEVCDSASKKLREEMVRLYDLPPEIVLLEIPEAYRLLGVSRWELVKGHMDGKEKERTTTNTRPDEAARQLPCESANESNSEADKLEDGRLRTLQSDLCSCGM